ALGRERGVGAAMEGLAAHVGTRRVGDPDGGQDLAVERAVPDGVVAVVGEPQRLVGGHVHAVGAMEEPLAPGAQEVAVAVEDHHGVTPATATSCAPGARGSSIAPTACT